MGHALQPASDAIPQRLPTVDPTRPTIVRNYFARGSSAGITLPVEQDPPIPMRFGEFLVSQGRLSRQQLFLALQMQDRYPNLRIGECATALGFLDLGDIEAMLKRFAQPLAA